MFRMYNRYLYACTYNLLLNIAKIINKIQNYEKVYTKSKGVCQTSIGILLL